MKSGSRLVFLYRKLSENCKITIDGRKLTVPHNITIIQACEAYNIPIPRFCYHNRLKIAGNCRMCLVQIEKMPKPIASCAFPVSEGLVIHTNSEMVKKAREGVMEFLLANHPLDCVICDQGGECDLQDQSMAYGNDRSRFLSKDYDKRSVEDKNFGPLIKTSMNRCIHCTRCIRFANELAGAPELGTTGRGNQMQIGMYLQDKLLNSELSGNVIDLCPVGALTSKPYAFTTRPWELKRTPSIDCMDSVQANIRIDIRNGFVMRILPREKDDINEEWIADKGRFSYDGLFKQKIITPMFRDNRSSFFKTISWTKALEILSKKIIETNSERIRLIAGSFTDMETIKSWQDLATILNIPALDFDGPRLGLPILSSDPSLITTPALKKIEKAKSILLVGTNPRKEVPLLNLRIRKAFLEGALIFLVGSHDIVDLGYEYKYLGNHPDDILKWSPVDDSILLISASAIADFSNARDTVSSLIKLQLKNDNFTLGIIQRWANRAGALLNGWGTSHASLKKKDFDLNILLTADDLSERDDVLNSLFNVYIGHNGSGLGFKHANLILPTTNYTEKESLWVNCEGRWQETCAAVNPSVQIKQDWTIVRALSEYLNAMTDGHSLHLCYNNLEDLRSTLNYKLGFVSVQRPDRPSIMHLTALINQPTDKKCSDPFFKSECVKDYYLTPDSISLSSKIMAECSLAFNSVIQKQR